VSWNDLIPHLAGIVLLALVALICKVASGGDLSQLVEGKDGRASTSKFQLVVWTAVGLYAFAAVFTAKILHGDATGISNFPANLLAAMGLSVLTATASKAITSSQVSSGQISKPSVGTVDQPSDPGAAALVQDDSGAPDLSKAQFLAWTIVSVFVYLYRLVGKVNLPVVGASIDMPDIDPVLLPLIGLGHAAYLGKKLTSSTVPQINGVTPAAGTPPRPVTMTGVSFGAPQGTSQVLIDSSPYYVSVSSWSDTSIAFEFPQKRSDGSNWRPGDVVRLALVVNGQQSANDVPFTIAVPHLVEIKPTTGRLPQSLLLLGTDFGQAQNGSCVLINGKPLAVVIDGNNWSDSKITFDLPDLDPDTGQPWPPNPQIQVGLLVNGKEVGVTRPFMPS
jgi:hypothetical protein